MTAERHEIVDMLKAAAERTSADKIAAAESRGRAAGWREAIEALRAHVEANYHPASIDGARLRKIAAELESLAPKETP